MKSISSVSSVSTSGDMFLIKGEVFKTSKMKLLDRIKALKEVSGISYSELADAAGMSPQQFSFKIRHALTIKEIRKLARYLELSDSQIVNIFVK